MAAKSLDTLLQDREKALAKIKKLDATIEAHRALTVVVCTGNVAYGKGCGASFAINTLEYIQTHWYREPYGCTGGAYWVAGEGQWKCPKCGRINRLYDKPEIEKLKPLFQSVANEYKD